MSGTEMMPCVSHSDQDAIQLEGASNPDEWQRMQVPMDWVPSPTFMVRFCQISPWCILPHILHCGIAFLFISRASRSL